MRYVASREEMQQIDAYSINTMGIPGIVLMEKGGACFRRSLFRESTDKESCTYRYGKGQ